MALFSFENKYVCYYGLEDTNTPRLFEKYKGLLIYNTASNKFDDIIDITDGGKVSSMTFNRTYTSDVVIYGITKTNFSGVQDNMENQTQLSLDSTIIISSVPRPLSLFIQKVGFLKYSNNTWYPSVSWSLNNNSIHTLKIDNKEVLQIKRNSDNQILYQH